MSVLDAEIGRAVRAIAEVFADEGTDPLVDWFIPAVHLLHPLARATIAPYVRDAGAGRGAAITRPLWVAEDPAECTAVAMAVTGLPAADGITFAEERAEDGTWGAVAYRVIECAADAAWGRDLPGAHRELEASSMAVMAELARVLRPHLDRIARPRSLLLHHALALLEDHGTERDGVSEAAAVAAVTCDHVTLRWGAEGLPVFLRLVGEEQLDVLTLVAGHDGRWLRDELEVLGQVFAVRAVGRPGLRVVDVPGDLGMAIGIVSSLPASAATATVVGALEAHLDLAREVAGAHVGARLSA